MKSAVESDKLLLKFVSLFQAEIQQNSREENAKFNFLGTFWYSKKVMVYDTKGLKTVDDKKKLWKNHFYCGYYFFKIAPARLLRKIFIFNEKDNCEFQQAFS